MLFQNRIGGAAVPGRFEEAGTEARPTGPPHRIIFILTEAFSFILPGTRPAGPAHKFPDLEELEDL